MSNVPTAERAWARAELRCCLRLPNGLASPDTTPRCWYFEIPNTHDTPEHWRELVARIVFDTNTALRRREPSDLAWIAVESIKVSPVRPRQVLTAPEAHPHALPWVNIDRQRVWEPAVCFYVDDAGRYDVMSGHDFSELLLYRLLGRGEITPEQCRGFLERYYGEAGRGFYDDREARLNNLTTVREGAGAPQKKPYEQPYTCCPGANAGWPGGAFDAIGVPPDVRVAGYGGEASEGAGAGGTASVYLESVGESPIQVLVTVRDFVGLSVVGAKSLMDSTPVIVLSDAPRAEAERFRSELERVGATASLR